jgi:hypothetical protein
MFNALNNEDEDQYQYDFEDDYWDGYGESARDCIGLEYSKIW